jgi:Protein of unknown function (DUF3577)
MTQTASASASTTTRSEKKFFDLHIDGVGYLNRIRQVRPKRGEPFLACDVSALVGPADAVEYRRFDCRVSGKDAQHLIRRCEQAVSEEKKVLVGFRLGDLWTDIFTYSKGPKEGQTGVSLKARLLLIRWIKVDGEMVYTAAPKAGETTDGDAPASDDAQDPPHGTSAHAEPAEAGSVAA